MVSCLDVPIMVLIIFCNLWRPSVSAIQLPELVDSGVTIDLYVCLHQIFNADPRQTQDWVRHQVNNYITFILYCIFNTFVDNLIINRFLGIFWKCARIGERKSPYVAISCLAMALSILFY